MIDLVATVLMLLFVAAIAAALFMALVVGWIGLKMLLDILSEDW